MLYFRYKNAPLNKQNFSSAKDLIRNYVEYIGKYYGDYAYDFTVHAHLHLEDQAS